MIAPTIKGKTKGQTEAEITTGMTQYVRDYLGRGPKGARTFILHDAIVVRISGVITPAEQALTLTEGGVELLKQFRRRLIESSRDRIIGIIEAATGAKVLSLHTDVSTRSGERVFLITVDRNLEEPGRNGF